jgi:hypothetical protein
MAPGFQNQRAEGREVKVILEAKGFEAKGFEIEEKLRQAVEALRASLHDPDNPLGLS